MFDQPRCQGLHCVIDKETLGTRLMFDVRVADEIERIDRRTQLNNRLQDSRIFCERKRRGKYSNERSGASVETARENGERREWGGKPYGRVRLARFTREDHAHGTSRFPKREENDCFAV